MAENYRTLTVPSVVEYVRQIPGLFAQGAKLSAKEVGDGNLNLVFIIKDDVTGKSVVLKQALPYARVVGESMPLTVDRSRIESEALQVQAKLCPEYTPRIFHVDHGMSLFVMEDLSDYKIMRKGLIEKNAYPHFAEQISEFLAKTLFYTSDLYLPPFAKKENVGKFINPELCKISEDLIFTQPYYDAPENNIPEEIAADVAALWDNEPLKLEVAKLKYHFMTRADALLHGDLHTGSIFIKEDALKVIDPEFAYYGPMGFDIGAVLANLLLNYCAQEGWADHAQELREVRERLLSMIADIWLKFDAKFRRLMLSECKDYIFSRPGFQDIYLSYVFAETVGFAGCKMIRRIHGLAHVADIDQIPDAAKRASAQRLALKIGQLLIMKREKIANVEMLTEMIKGV
ncbi:MAG TPA: S-methyl-5-thioribose kinase [Bacilli bacterium]